nr:MAG TPA: hypothetical protein [Caudoviricetes sp.]DAU16223.1 MAG TPA: hypothetical protein [Caudoviricetes sp.]
MCNISRFLLMKDNKEVCSFLLFRGDINGYYPC